MERLRRLTPLLLIAAGSLLFATGTFIGLAVAPAERYMGEVQRIMYVHVPTAWTAMLVLTWAFICGVAWLLTANWKWDHRLEGAIEASILLCFLLSIQGAIWAKPTWGVWWDWDPRLTTVAILLMVFLGIAALRRFVEQPARRATWSAVATVIGYVDVPIVYFSVKWWNSLHQQQSTPSTISREFLIPLMANFAGLLLVMIGTMVIRGRVARIRVADEIGPDVIPSRASGRGAPPYPTHPDPSLTLGMAVPMSGIVTGGWTYVWSAYAISIAMIAGYVIRTIATWRKESAQTEVLPVTRSE